MPDDRTIALYDEKAAEYAARFDGPGCDPRLSAFIDALPQGARVLDLGCGPGHAAARMAQAGLAVDAADASPEMVALAARHKGVTAWRATFEQIEGDALYDGIWAGFSLLHAPREALPRHLAAIRRALRPGGAFWIGMKTGTGTRRDSLGRRYTYYTEAELRARLREAGLPPGQGWTGEERGLDGTMAPWVVIAAIAADGEPA